MELQSQSVEPNNEEVKTPASRICGGAAGVPGLSARTLRDPAGLRLAQISLDADAPYLTLPFIRHQYNTSPAMVADSDLTTTWLLLLLRVMI